MVQNLMLAMTAASLYHSQWAMVKSSSAGTKALLAFLKALRLILSALLTMRMVIVLWEVQFRPTVLFCSALRLLILSQLRRRRSQRRRRSRRRRTSKLTQANSRSLPLRKAKGTRSRKVTRSMPTTEALLSMEQSLMPVTTVESPYHLLSAMETSSNAGTKAS